LEYHHYRLDAGKTVQLTIHPEHQSFIYPLSGAVQIGKERYERGVLPLFDSAAGLVMIENPFTEPAEFIFLSGKPIGEPIARYGPFVMNTEAEIEAAFYEYQRGEMGVLSGE
jgi:redox-sensitive bicupin YhaK (pirin superfamily)